MELLKHNICINIITNFNYYYYLHANATLFQMNEITQLVEKHV